MPVEEAPENPLNIDSCLMAKAKEVFDVFVDKALVYIPLGLLLDIYPADIYVDNPVPNPGCTVILAVSKLNTPNSATTISTVGQGCFPGRSGGAGGLPLLSRLASMEATCTRPSSPVSSQPGVRVPQLHSSHRLATGGESA